MFDSCWVKRMKFVYSKEFITETLSDNILEMTVTGIENDESILDTVNIYVFGYKTED